MMTPPTLPLYGSQRPIDPGGHPSFGTDDLTLSFVMAVLRRRWLLIALILVSTVGLGGYYLLRATPAVYEATTVLRMELGQLNLFQPGQNFSNENQLTTEIELLRRRSTAVAVIDSLGLRALLLAPRGAQVSAFFSLLKVAPDAGTPLLHLRVDSSGRLAIRGPDSSDVVLSARVGDTVHVEGVTFALLPAVRAVSEVSLQVVSLDQAVRIFQSALVVSRPRDANLIAITVRGTDRTLTASAANLLAEQRISARRGIRLARSGGSIRFLKQQLDTLGIQLRVAEDSERMYRERAGVVVASEQAKAKASGLAQLEAERRNVESDRQALGTLVRQMQGDSAGVAAGALAPSRRLMSSPTLFRNPTASQLMGALVLVENERAALLARRTPQDPDVQVLTSRIRELDGQLQGIAGIYLKELTDQAATLETAARRQESELRLLPEKEVRMARLQRDVLVQQGLYTMVQTRLKEAQITEAMEDPTLSVVDRAVEPDRPVSQRMLRNFALLFVLATLLALGAALGPEVADSSLRSRAQVIRASGLPILGAVPRLQHRFRALPPAGSREVGRIAARIGAGHHGTRPKSTPARPLPAASLASLLVTHAPGAYAESLYQLQANLALAFRAHPIKVLVFTSPLPGEGKTLSIVNFALTLAGQGVRVLLIDADLRCGKVNEAFGCPRAPGFAEVLAGSVRFEDAVQSIPVGETGALTLVPSGTLLSVPRQVLNTQRIRDVLDALTPQFDLVLIDSPPVNLLADAAILGSAADGVLLVVRAGQTRIEALRFALDQLSAAQAPVLGTLLNDIDPRRQADDGSYRYLTEVDRYYSGRR